MQSDENIQGLGKILNSIRAASILLVLINFYTVCHPAFVVWHFTAPIADKILFNFSQNTWIFQGFNNAKISALILLGITVFGNKGKKDEKITLAPLLYYLIIGLLLFFISSLFLKLPIEEVTIAELYISITTIGYLSILAGSTRLSRLLYLKLSKDIFNEIGESFPQEERLLENDFSINLPAEYALKGKIRKSWINVINGARGCLILGSPGSGKTYFCIRHWITQGIEKQFTFFIYDFKFPDLTVIAYNNLLKNAKLYKKPPKLYIINFDDLSRTHRCNVLYPTSLIDISDATEASRTIMLALNREWQKKQGDFFTESPINFVTAIFWYLKKYENGKYCTLPHAIELAQIDYEKLFPVLSLQEEISALLNPFISAFVKKAYDQLEGQVASAKICLARLVSPSLYYVLSGNDFSLDLNNPENPKIICVGNNPAKQQTYGAVLSLYVERMLKLINKKGQLKSSLIFDEFPTIYADISNTIATGRSNLINTTIAVQDLSQLRRDYGKENADVIMNLCGNVISGQVLGDTAKFMSDRIGKIMQERESVSINAQDTSLSKSTQLEVAVTPSRISNLSSGEFVGAVADNPTQKIKLKAFHNQIINDHEAIAREEAAYVQLPIIREIDTGVVMANYYQIKRDITNIIDSELAKIRKMPGMSELMPNSKAAPASVSL